MIKKEQSCATLRWCRIIELKRERERKQKTTTQQKTKKKPYDFVPRFFSASEISKFLFFFF